MPVIKTALRKAVVLLQDSFQYPFQGDQQAKRFALGALFSVPLVILPQINPDNYLRLIFSYLALVALASPASGYFLRIVQRTSKGNKDPPLFKSWTKLIVSGIKAGVVYLTFLVFAEDLLEASLGPLGVGLDLLFGFTLPFFEEWIGPSILTELLALIALLVIYPAAVGSFSEEERITAAVDISTIWPALRQGNYLVGALAAAVVFFLSQLTFLLLFAVFLFVDSPRPVTFLVLGFSGFYFGMAYNHLIGQTWSQVRQENRENETSPGNPVKS